MTEKCGEEEYILDSYEIYRVPVGKDENGRDFVKSGQAERVVSGEEEKIGLIWGMNSRFIIYELEKGDRLARYDIQSGEKILLKDIPDKEAVSYVVSESHVFACTWGGLFVNDMEGTTWTKVSDSKEPYLCEKITYNEDALFYTTPSNGDEMMNIM